MKKIPAIIFLFYISCSYSQGLNKIDSLKLVLQNSPVDSTIQGTCSALGWLLKNSSTDSALFYENRAMQYAKKLKSNKRMAVSFNHLGVIYWIKGQYNPAIENTLSSLEIYEKLGKEKEMSDEYTNLALIFSLVKKFTEAKYYGLKAIRIREKLKDDALIASAYQNLGVVYYQADDKEKAAESFIKAATSQEKSANKIALAGTYNNVAVIFTEQKKYPAALEYYKKSVALYANMNDKLGLTQDYSNMGQLYVRENDFLKAKTCLDKALSLATELQSQKEIEGIYFVYSDWSLAQNQYKQGLEYFKKGSAIKDSLTSSENNKQFAEAQAKYETNEKNKEILLLNKDRDLQSIALEKQTAEAEKQQTQRNAFIIGFGLVLILTLFIFRGSRQKQKTNKDLAEKNYLIEVQKKIVEEKNTSITDSINYAKRIQQAKLPKLEEITSSFKESFVLFKPKDIVSGDFYFFHKSEDAVIIAAADCTGHGVPGAFMSMIGSEKLHDAVSQSKDTSVILGLLNRGIKSSLRQSESGDSTKDGMDIAICSVDIKNNIINYSGAHIPLWIIRKGHTEIEELKATKKAIGGWTEDNQHFESHHVHLQKGDTFYMSTDGYADQFGGKKGKKLMTKKFKELLISIQDKTMKEQERHLIAFTEEWKALTEQIDDILVIGVRL